MATIDFGRDICGNLDSAERREWLVTNGLGGFASGTVAGTLTRRYHGLLFAALEPPLGRTLLVTKFDETAEYGGTWFPLFANRWADGAITPQGYRHLEQFHLEGQIPVWTFAFGDALLEKRVWMLEGANTTCVQYRLLRGTRPVKLAVKVLANYRDYHSLTRASGRQFKIETLDRGLRITAHDGAVPYYLLSNSARMEASHDWHYAFSLAMERYRGLADREDHLAIANCLVELVPGQSAFFAASTDPEAAADVSLEDTVERSSALVATFAATNSLEPADVPGWVRQLVLAASQFIVKREVAGEQEGKTIIAGYPWFGDWGRDTMISLPGLTLVTGHPETTNTILRTFAHFADEGMLPNRFPDAGDTPEYNTVDAALWFFEAVRQYYEAASDRRLLEDLYPAMAEIIDQYRRGTRFGIGMDEQDGLLFAGEPGVQLTWMDAKVGDWVVTPRIGKPVEVNALWLNALATQARFADVLGKPAAEYEKSASTARRSFQKFWSPNHGWCFDVIDGPGGNDASLRPNQIFAVSLPESGLTADQQRAVVDVCGRTLLTSFGLRSLAPSETGYAGQYSGGLRRRDGAYHQGTAWAWLLGPFALAHLRVYNAPVTAASFLDPIRHHLQTHGLGNVSEIFDGDPPFHPRGCIAQAWSVAEILRAWVTIERHLRNRNPAATL